MPSARNTYNTHTKYNDALYPRRQMRDSIGGSVKVKNSGELYLPMPSSFLGIPDAPLTNQTAARRELVGYNAEYLPHSHQNPAYRAYLQRARFPDITANGLRGFMGMATKVPPEIKLPSKLKYIVDSVNYSGESLEDFFAYVVSEILTVGNTNIVVDVDPLTKEFYLTTYSAESTVDWNYTLIKGGIDLDEIYFVEGNDGDEDEQAVKAYLFDEEGFAISQEFKDGDEVGDPIELSYRGKRFDRLPVFPVGSMENIPDPQPIPLQGISDISIAMYQEDADLRQAHFMTCNPTLFVFGAKATEKPTVIGSQVVVSIANPQGRAEYPATDTSALNHIMEYKKELMNEAADYGASILTNANESGEARSMRQANRGLSLVHVVNMAGRAIQDALEFVSDISGSSGEVAFKPSTEFAEMVLNANDINALVMGWLQGAWDKGTVLDNMRSAGYIKHDRTNQDIINALENEPPSVTNDLGAGNNGE